jgi:PGF-CTERM protein
MITDGTYHGPSAFSESETKANADYQLELRPDMVVTMHTGIAEFYWPWGWTHEKSPDDAFFVSLESPFENATNGRVDAMQGAELYIVSGASDDWAYGILGVPGFTFEVHEDQFIPVYGDPIPAVIADQLAGLDFIVKNVRHMGAWIEPTRTGEGIHLENQGWGAAANVTVTVGEWTRVVERIERDERVVLPDAPAGEVRVEYAPLFIETSPHRNHTLAADVQTAALPETASVPGFTLPLALAALAAIVLVRRRK